MKTQAWKPPATVTDSVRKEGVFVDELVQFCEIESGAIGEIPAVAAFLMAVELVARKKPFEIRDASTFEVYLQSDGKELSGAHSMQQVINDSAVILDAIVKKNLREFSSSVLTLIRDGANALPAGAGQPAASPAAAEESENAAPSGSQPAEFVATQVEGVPAVEEASPAPADNQG